MDTQHRISRTDGSAPGRLHPTPRTHAEPTVTPTPSTTEPTVSTPTPTPSETTTPTPTMSAEQEAALSQTRSLLTAADKLATRPAKEFSQRVITETLQPFMTGEMLTFYLNGFRDLADRGVHERGSAVEVWSEAAAPTKPEEGVVSVLVTVCRDQRGVEVVDAKGNVQKDDYPDFLATSFDMRDVGPKNTFVLWQDAFVSDSCDR